jgi:hypothetical protein
MTERCRPKVAARVGEQVLRNTEVVYVAIFAPDIGVNVVGAKAQLCDRFSFAEYSEQ